MTKTNNISIRLLSVVMALIMLAGIIYPITKPIKVKAVTESQLNIVERADYMYDSTWVCQKTISGWKGKYTYVEGETYRIPYAWPVTAGIWVGYGITVDNFLLSTRDPDSDFYTKQSYYEGNEGSYAPYYGSDCSTFLSWCWALPSRRTTTSIPNQDGVSLIGDLTEDSIKNELSLGDALDYVGSHVVLVTDITYDEGGSITGIEITEQTPPQLKRTVHTVESLLSAYAEDYRIYRYSGEVSPPPVKDSNPDLFDMPTSTLSVGSTGDGVHWVQAALYQKGYNVALDGVFTEELSSAISLFQSEYGLTASGIADMDTIAKLNALWTDKTGLYKTTGSLNMRSGPGVSNGVVTVLSPAAKVTVVGYNEENTWANIIYNGLEGWVNKRYLTFVRKLEYTLTIDYQNSAESPAYTFTKDRAFSLGTFIPENADYELLGWTLLRHSDSMYYSDLGWVEEADSASTLAADSTLIFDYGLINRLANDDSYTLSAVWGDKIICEINVSVFETAGELWDTGTLTFKASADRADVTYSWSCSDPSFSQYLTGTDTDTLVITIPEPLSDGKRITFYCTVTDNNANTGTSEAIIFDYYLSEMPDYLLGDVTMDGTINAADFNIMKRISAGAITVAPGSALNLVCDINSDGNLTAVDLNLLKKYLAGSYDINTSIIK